MARRLTWLLIVAGLAGVVVGSLAAAQLRRALPFGVPLASPTSVAVGDDGRVYLGTGVDRVHVYGPDGRFLRGWFLDRGAGPVRVRVTGPDRIEVATAGSGRLHVFDREGALVETSRDPEAFARFGAGARDDVAEGPDGARYALEDGALVRLAPPPRTVLAPPVRPPLSWFAASPLPALTAVLVTSVAALFGGILLSARRRRTPRTAD